MPSKADEYLRGSKDTESSETTPKHLATYLLEEWMRRHDEMKAERDSLREALSVMLEDYSDACDEWDHENQEYGRKVIEQARAALKDIDNG